MKCSVCGDKIPNDTPSLLSIPCDCKKGHYVCPECIAEIAEAEVGTLLFVCKCGKEFKTGDGKWS
jgi:hypothetical protein